MNLIAEGKPEEGIRKLQQAVAEQPDSVEYRRDLAQKRTDAIAKYIVTAESERSAGKLENAEAVYKRIQQIEPGNARAAEGLEALARERRYAPVLEQAREALKKGELDRAESLATMVSTENPANAAAVALKRQIDDALVRDRISEPMLRLSSRKPISLEFRDANLKVVLEALARSTGVNFILDKDVRPDLRTTVFLRQASLEDAIELILQTNRLEKKVLNPNTILIYANTPEKQKDYQELVVKGFYLENADVKQTQAMLKAILKSRDIFVDEKLNLLVMRDTPEAIRLASKLIAMHDLYEPEVMLEVEVLEINRSRLLELGIDFPNQLTVTPLSTGTGLTLSQLKRLNSDSIGVSLPSAAINLRREVSDANILANPRIRARNREKAKIMIGDKIPVFTTTATNNSVFESAQYVDVGIKLDVEPNIYLQDDVAIKIGLEVSSIVSQIKTPAGSLAYQIGSRSASTVLRLKDGETQVLAGLISDEDRMAANRVPGIGDLPVVGRLFSSQKDDRQKTEIVLSITPHLVRNINRPDAASSEFWSGTETSLKTKPLLLRGERAVDEARQAGKPVTKEHNAEESGEAVESNIAPTTIEVSWQGPNQVKAGEQFKLALRLKSDGGLRSLPLQIGFDPAAFQILNIQEGEFFRKYDAKTSLSSNVDPTLGKAFISIVRSGTGGAQGDDTVATLVVRALKAGSQGEFKLLSVTPITVGEKPITPVVPAPFIVNVTN
jgi:general secretion pathway protein D